MGDDLRISPWRAGRTAYISVAGGVNCVYLWRSGTSCACEPADERPGPASRIGAGPSLSRGFVATCEENHMACQLVYLRKRRGLAPGGRHGPTAPRRGSAALRRRWFAIALANCMGCLGCWKKVYVRTGVSPQRPRMRSRNRPRTYTKIRHPQVAIRPECIIAQSA